MGGGGGVDGLNGGGVSAFSGVRGLGGSGSRLVVGFGGGGKGRGLERWRRVWDGVGR